MTLVLIYAFMPLYGFWIICRQHQLKHRLCGRFDSYSDLQEQSAREVYALVQVLQSFMKRRGFDFTLFMVLRLYQA